MATVNIYCEAQTGNDANGGTSVSDAVQTLAQVNVLFAALTASEKNDVIIHLSGQFTNEKLNLTLSSAPLGTGAYEVQIIGENGCTIDNITGALDCIYILRGNGVSPTLTGTLIKGITLLNSLSNQSHRAIDCPFSYLGDPIYLDSCHVEGFAQWGRSYTKQFRNTVFKDFALIDETNGQTDKQNATFKMSKNCTYDNCSFYIGGLFVPFYIRLFSETIISRFRIWFDEFYVFVKNNQFKNMDIVLGGLDFYPSTALNFIRYNNFENCNFGFVQQSGSTMPLYLGTPVACVTDVEIRAKMAVDGVTYAANWGEDEAFKTIPTDTFGYPADETVNELNRHQGAYRYAISQATPEANPNLTDMGGYYVTTAATSIVYILELPQGRNIRRAILHINRTGVNEQLGTNGQVELSIETSHDGITYGAATTYLSGIDSSTLDFDFMDVGVKKVRITATNTGGFGEIQYLGATIETNTLEDRLSQTDTRTLYAAGTIPVNVLSLQNKANNTTMLDMVQANPSNQLVISQSGGIETVAIDGIMNTVFEPSGVFTRLTYAYWLYIPIDFIPTKDHYTSGNWNAAVAPNAFGVTMGLRYISPNLAWRIIAANGDYLVINYDLQSVSSFLTKYAGRFIHLCATFDNGVVRLYIDAVNVFTYTNSTSSVKFPADGVFSIHGTNNRVGRSFDVGFKSEANFISVKKAFSAEEVVQLFKSDQHNHKYLRV